MPSGRVRWFDANKGYGFIQNEQGADVFLPAAALPEGVKTLRKGAKVEYSVVEGRRGPQAMASPLWHPRRLWSKQLDRSRHCGGSYQVAGFRWEPVAPPPLSISG